VVSPTHVAGRPQCGNGAAAGLAEPAPPAAGVVVVLLLLPAVREDKEEEEEDDDDDVVAAPDLGQGLLLPGAFKGIAMTTCPSPLPSHFLTEDAEAGARAPFGLSVVPAGVIVTAGRRRALSSASLLKEDKAIAATRRAWGKLDMWEEGKDESRG
jgi:hypothetical protein